MNLFTALQPLNDMGNICGRFFQASSKDIARISPSGPLTHDVSELCERCQYIDLTGAFDWTPQEGNGLVLARLGSMDSWSSKCAFCIFLKDSGLRLLKSFEREMDSAPVFSSALSNLVKSSDERDKMVWVLGRRSLSNIWSYHDVNAETPLVLGQSVDASAGLQSHDVEMLRRSDADTAVISLWPTKDPGGAAFGEILEKQAVPVLLPAAKHKLLTRPEIQREKCRFLRDDADLSLLKIWLASCLSDHDCSSGVAFDGRHPDWVIDCRTRRLVPWNNQKYAALSYVWGSRSPLKLREYRAVRTTFRLPEHIPRTIEDALKVSLSIDLHYLWVDRWCVDQYHSALKTAQLDAMAAIFESAEVTIIALSDDADSGLYGISDAPSRYQQVFQFAGTFFGTMMPTLPECLETATWNKRAWTFQEAGLSRRCIVFDTSQLFFVCNENIRCETFPQGISPHFTSTQQWIEIDKGPLILKWVDQRATGGTTDEYFSRWQASVDAYLSRKLTYAKDGLNAFRGMLARSKLATFYGLPIAKLSNQLDTAALESAFIDSLLWHHKESKLSTMLQQQKWPKTMLSKKHGIPSWTWAASNSPGIAFEIFHGESIHSFCRIHIGLENERQPVPVKDIMKRGLQSILPEIGPRLIFKDAFVVRDLDFDALLYFCDDKYVAKDDGTDCKRCITRSGIPLVDGPLLSHPDRFSRRDLGVSIFYDPECMQILGAVALKKRKLDAMLMTARSSYKRHVVVVDDIRVTHAQTDEARNAETGGYLFVRFWFLLLVHHKGLASRVGVMNVKWMLPKYQINMEAITRQDVIIV